MDTNFFKYMKKLNLVITSVLIFIAALLIYFFSGLNQDILNVFLIIVIIYLIRTPLVRFIASVYRKKLVRIVISSILNIILLVFLFWMVFLISSDLFIAVFSFLVVAISLTFKTVITNTASGALILTSEKFEIGDLIETNGIQGIVEEINLNYTEMREFDGVSVVIPNSKVYGAMLTKFTHKRSTLIDLPKRKEEKKGEKFYERYLDFFNNLIAEEKKITRYAKTVQILSSVDPATIEDKLDEVFEEYSSVFGVQPDFVIDITTRSNRVRIILHITSKQPEYVVNNVDSLLRDIVFKLYPDKIYKGWEEYKQKNLPHKGENEEGI